MIDVSIIIISHNNRNALSRAIVSARRFTGALQVETIVVDNGSTDGSAQMIERLYSNVQLVANASNRGYATACGQGLEAANGRTMLLLDSEVELTQDCLEALLRVLDAHPLVGACGPLAEGPALPAGGFPSLGISLLSGEKRRRAEEARLRRRVRERECYDVDWLRGLCLLVRREVLPQIGGPDRRLRAGHAEMAWCRRMQQAQWRRVLVPGALCRYEPTPGEGPSAGALLRDEYTYWRLNKGWLPTWALYNLRLLQAGAQWWQLVMENVLTRNQDPEIKAFLRAAAGRWGWHLRNGWRVLFGSLTA
ncbi:MAG: glycosyltransferase [Armatimonadota bacterium]